MSYLEDKYDSWSCMVKDCNDSNMKVIDYCKANDIKLSTYYYRKRKLKQLDSENKTTEPIEFYSISVIDDDIHHSLLDKVIRRIIQVITNA